jgi:hypothetical protein
MKKLNEEINNIKKLMGIQENLGNDPSVSYHGSAQDFNSFDFDKIGSGMGKDVHGYGIYLTENQEIAQFYATELATSGKRGYVYTVKIRNTTFLEWETPIDEYHANQIYNRFQKITDDEYRLNEIQEVLGLSENYYGDHPLTFSLYDFLSVVMDSKKAASELLNESGIDGIEFNSKENGFNSTNYVIFDPNNLKIINKDIITPRR